MLTKVILFGRDFFLLKLCHCRMACDIQSLPIIYQSQQIQQLPKIIIVYINYYMQITISQPVFLYSYHVIYTTVIVGINILKAMHIICGNIGKASHHDCLETNHQLCTVAILSRQTHYLCQTCRYRCDLSFLQFVISCLYS